MASHLGICTASYCHKENGKTDLTAMDLYYLQKLYSLDCQGVVEIIQEIGENKSMYYKAGK